MFTKSWLVRLPSGSPFFLSPSLEGKNERGGVVKLPTMCLSRLRISISGIYLARIENKMSWSILAKNLRMSHFSTKQVLVCEKLAVLPNSRKRAIALCVPFPTRQEYESNINMRSKNGES